MVVSFNDDAKTARLSLRQSEILEKLANVVEDLQASNEIPADMYGFHRQRAFIMSSCFPEMLCHYFTRNTGGICSSQLQERHTPGLFMIFFLSNEICSTGTYKSILNSWNNPF